jgi:hypothetical protein
MDQSVLNKFGNKPEHKYFYCDSCNSLLPAPGFYCVQCEPPQSPELEPQGDLKFSHAMLRISLLALMFLIVAVFKLDIKLNEVFLFSAQEAPLKLPKDEGFKIILKVNTELANLRSLPNTKKGKIIDTLKMGDQVEVLGAESGWSKVKFKLQAGEGTKIGWIAKKLLESEIK